MIYEIINPLSLQWNVWFITLAIAFMAGLSKSGIKGAIMLGIPLLAVVYGAKQSTGILLPFLIMGDLLAIKFYWQHAHWRYVIRLLPWAIIGVLVAVFIGKYIDDDVFRNCMATILLVCVSLIIINDLRKNDNNLFQHPKVLPIFGLAGGFATMIGNLAGPVFSLYLLAVKMPKKEFIGTGAMFYLALNFFKIPFHVWSWETINLKTAQMNVVMFPVLLIGFAIGSRLVKYIPEKAYRYFVLGITFVSALLLYFK